MDIYIPLLGNRCYRISFTYKHHLSNHLVRFILFSCNSQKKRLYLQYKRKYRRTDNEYK